MQAIQCTKCRFCSCSRQSKTSRCHFYAYTFTVFCIGTWNSTDGKTPESEIHCVRLPFCLNNI